MSDEGIDEDYEDLIVKKTTSFDKEKKWVEQPQPPQKAPEKV